MKPFDLDEMAAVPPGYTTLSALREVLEQRIEILRHEFAVAADNIEDDEARARFTQETDAALEAARERMESKLAELTHGRSN